MPKRKVIQRKPRQMDIKKECYFCKESKNPDFLEYEVLKRFISERGKIYSRARSGLCSKHQRKLTVAIKRARLLSFLPFVVRAE